MSKPDNKEQREQFEECFRARVHLADDHLCLGDFGSDTAQTAWIFWQEAWVKGRESLILELASTNNSATQGGVSD